MSENEIKLFDITDLAITELKERYNVLKINGLEDKEGFKIVRAARLDMKGYRIAIDKRRKELVEDALKHQRKINSEAKRIIEQLSEIENYLSSQESLYLLQLEEIEKEKQRKLDLVKQERIDKLISIGFRYNGKIFIHAIKNDISVTDEINDWNDERFDKFYSEYKQYYDKYETQRIEKEKEAKRIAEELKVEQDKQKAELEAERIKLAKQQAEAIKKAKELQDKEDQLIKEAMRIDKEKILKEQKNNIKPEITDTGSDANIPACGTFPEINNSITNNFCKLCNMDYINDFVNDNICKGCNDFTISVKNDFVNDNICKRCNDFKISVKDVNMLVHQAYSRGYYNAWLDLLN